MPNDNVKWFIKISSFANVNDFTQEQIEYILSCYKHPEYQDFRSEHTSKIETEFDKKSIAQWQVKKSNELEQKFFDNLKFEIKDNILYINIEFEINFTEEFDKRDVIEWSEGLNRICKIYPMVGLYNIQKDYINYDRDTYRKGNNLLSDLRKNESFVVYKNSEKT